MHERSRPTPERGPSVGSFVRIGNDLGKLTRVDGVRGDVEFFDAPVPGGVSTVTVELQDVRAVALEAQTRIWWSDNGQWRIGRVLAPPDENTPAYLVAFAGQKNEELTPDQFSVRWSRPLVDPVRLLESRATDSRFMHRSRSAFVRQVLKHRAAVDGLVGISSSAVQLHQHQVNAARRVLLDPVRRYLLADEVGLGKTIEAGMVIRQLLLDEPGTRVLVLVPDPLIGQWEKELDEKFDVQGLNGGWVDVEPYRSANAMGATDRDPVSLLVVDEAHRLTDGAVDAGLYGRVAALAARCPSLLLLSATPVRSNEDSFLKLLHLLDPSNYRLEEIDAFRRRVEQRDEVGAAVSLLDDDSPTFLIRDAANQLRSIFPEDNVLGQMLDRLASVMESEADFEVQAEARRVKHYVSDTYRIHRRLIRTRRNDRLQDEFPVRRRARSERWHLVDPDPRREAVVEALDRFRSRLVDDDALQGPDILRTVAARCLAATPAVRALQHALDRAESSDLLDFEHDVIERLRHCALGAELATWLDDALDDEPDGRLGAMCDWAWARANKSKVAACTSFTSVGRVAYKLMADRYGEHRVAALLADMPSHELQRQFDKAQRDEHCTLLVCDTIAEEGWNLQFIGEVLHLDVPWSANRLEQRLGRFDRFVLGRKHLEPVQSTVVVDREPLDAVTGAWIRLLDQGFQAFSRSSATLQYALPEREAGAIDRAVESGFMALDKEVETERSELESLRRRIDGQDRLDSIEDSEEDDRFFKELAVVDGNPRPFGEAVSRWIGKALNFSGSKTESGTTVRFGVNKKNPPLLPESEVRRIGVHGLDRRYAIRRDDAIAMGVPLLRPGQPIVDGAFSLCLREGRGVSFSGVHEVGDLPEGAPPMLAFFFDVIIEPIINEQGGLSQSDRESLQRRATRHLQPSVEPIWIVPGRGELPEPLRRKYVERFTSDLGEDTERFHELTSNLDWPAQCRTAEAQATAKVLERPSVSESIGRAKSTVDEEEARVNAQRSARAQTHDEPFDQVASEVMYRHIRDAVTAPSVRIDNCGVVIVTRPAQ